MREILFRGKRTDNGKWVEGFLYIHEPPLQGIVPNDYIPEKSKYYILKTAFADWNLPRQVEFTEVDPETVGQFTGLLDKNKKQAFEGDIVQTYYSNGVELVETIVFESGKFMVESDFDGIKMYANIADGIKRVSFDKNIYMTEFEIIGNIHENKSLLEENEC